MILLQLKGLIHDTVKALTPPRCGRGYALDAKAGLELPFTEKRWFMVRCPAEFVLAWECGRRPIRGFPSVVVAP
jgi:hypothetical protein